MFLSFYALNAFFLAWKFGGSLAGREILPLIALWALPFSMSVKEFGGRLWFLVVFTTLSFVTLCFSILVTLYRWLANSQVAMLGAGLYNLLSHFLGLDVGLFFPDFPAWPGYGTLRPYDYLFISMFIAYTILMILLPVIRNTVRPTRSVKPD